jgi:hypothetical protein
MFSSRLLGTMCERPPAIPAAPEHPHPHLDRIKTKVFGTDPDVELANRTSLDITPSAPAPSSEASHYGIAMKMIHYNSVDIGDKCEYFIFQSCHRPMI